MAQYEKAAHHGKGMYGMSLYDRYGTNLSAHRCRLSEHRLESGRRLEGVY